MFPSLVYDNIFFQRLNVLFLLNTLCSIIFRIVHFSVLLCFGHRKKIKVHIIISLVSMCILNIVRLWQAINQEPS